MIGCARERPDRLPSDFHVDFLERDNYENTLLPNARSVGSLVTHMDEFTLLWIFENDAGLYVALDPECPAERVVDDIEPLV